MASQRDAVINDSRLIEQRPLQLIQSPLHADCIEVFVSVKTILLW